MKKKKTQMNVLSAVVVIVIAKSSNIVMKTSFSHSANANRNKIMPFRVVVY